MRGMGEELDMLQQAQRDVVAARYRGRVYRGGAEEDEGHGGGTGHVAAGTEGRRGCEV